MANQKKITPFSIHTKDVVLVKPSKPTPSTVLSLSTLDNNPDLNNRCQTVYVYKANPNGGQKDPSCMIKEALSKALFFYYPLAGKLKSHHTDGKLRIICNNASSGVPFLEATANCELSSLNYLDGNDVETANHLVFDYHSDSEEDETSGHHVLVLQVTKFLCGGFTIGMGLSHSVCDGFGASQFFRAMTELASGKDEPSVKPIWEREKLTGTILKEPIKSPIDKTSAAISPFWPTSSLLSHQCFNVKPESIRKLKTSLTIEDNNNHNITTLESLGAYVWRSRNRAMKLSSEGKTMFCLAVGVRQHVDPPLPDGYYGNAFVAANVVLKVKELEEKPLHEIVKLIKQSKQGACRNDYVRNCINVLETTREGNVRTQGTGASTVITDWRQLGLLEEVDFGWKGSVNIVPATWNMLGYVVDLCLFLPPSHLDPAMKGGVRVFVSLPEAAMPKFREEMEKLECIGENDGGI